MVGLALVLATPFLHTFFFFWDYVIVVGIFIYWTLLEQFPIALTSQIERIQDFLIMPYGTFFPI